VIAREGCYLEDEVDVEKLIVLVKEPRGNLRRLALWTPEPRLTLLMMFITTKTTAPLTTIIMFLLLLGHLFKVRIRYFCGPSGRAV
jgi:hypothetical protein